MGIYEVLIAKPMTNKGIISKHVTESFKCLICYGYRCLQYCYHEQSYDSISMILHRDMWQHILFLLILFNCVKYYLILRLYQSCKVMSVKLMTKYPI